MEKKNWNSSTLIQSNEPHCSSELNSIFNPIESTLTSIEISPQSCYSTPLNSPPKLNLSSLIEPQIMANFAVSGNNLTSLGSFNGDPGFIERATKNSCFGSGNLAQFGISEVSISNLQSCKLSRVSSNQSIRAAGLGGPFGDVNCAIGKKFSGVSTPENGELGDSREGSSVSEQNPDGEMGLKAQNDSSSRKRKSAPKSKLKQIPSPCPEKVGAEKEESDAKRSKKEEDGEKEEDEEKGEDKVGDTKPEPPKDYIHVRARRGQATDSHSLAERVRREKISERMKFLQDLVPGCNKVTGKATVLDEIINYVQSLQRQVEFLSMKLATVNPKTDFNMEALLSKDKALVQNTYELGSAAPALSFGYQPQHQIPPLLSSMLNGTDSAFSMNPLKSSIPANPNCIHLPSMDGFEDDAHAISQLPTFWDSDLHSIVQMGLAQTHPQIVQGTLQNTQMKAEL